MLLDGLFSHYWFTLPVQNYSPKVKWWYDCENPADEDDKLEPINQDIERLQNDLFEQYDATVAPNDLSTFTVEATKANFFVEKSFMTSYARFRAVHLYNYNTIKLSAQCLTREKNTHTF